MKNRAYQHKKIQSGFAGGLMILTLLFPLTVLPEDKGEKGLTEKLEQVDLTLEAEKAKEAWQRARQESSRAQREKREVRKALVKAKREAARWTRIKKTKSLLTLVHNDQFVIKTLPMGENFYIPEVSLSLDPSSVSRFSQKLAYHFVFAEGQSVLLHFEIFYYDEHGVVYPNYVLQLNFDIPQKLFKNRQSISAEELKGYLAWVHPDFPHGDLFLKPSAGHLYLWRIKKGHLMGRLDMKFEHEKLKTPIHLYGKVRAYQMTKEEYSASQAEVGKKIAMGKEALDSLPLHRDRLRPRYEYKLRKIRDPWVDGRSSNLWKGEKEEGLKD